jgi:hypothetical protein
MIDGHSETFCLDSLSSQSDRWFFSCSAWLFVMQSSTILTDYSSHCAYCWVSWWFTSTGIRLQRRTLNSVVKKALGISLVSFVPCNAYVIDAEVFYKRQAKTVDGDFQLLCVTSSVEIQQLPPSGTRVSLATPAAFLPSSAQAPCTSTSIWSLLA